MLMEDIRFDPATGQIAHRLVHGLRDAARARPVRRSRSTSNPVPTKTNPLGVKGAGEAGSVGAMPAVGQRDGRRAVPARHPPHRDARHARAAVARDPRGTGIVSHDGQQGWGRLRP